MPALMMVRLAPERTVCWSRRYARTSSRRMRIMKSSAMRLLCRLVGILATQRASGLARRDRAPRWVAANQIIEDVPLPRLPACFADAPLDLFQRQIVDRARRGDHILFDHQAAHVVGPEEKRDL